MCTAMTYQSKDFYFGRTLDHDRTYGEEIVILPRRFPLPFCHLSTQNVHYAWIGMAHVAEEIPLFYDAFNEKGLAIAALHFVGFTTYGKPRADRVNVAGFELIPWLLGQCSCIYEVREQLARVQLTDDAFSAQLPPSPLHWLVADRHAAIVVECTADGLHVYENPVGVLTNAPPFPQQLFSLHNHMHLSAHSPKNTFCRNLPLQPYSLGMGALGLPGDWSSPSRFVRAVFAKCNTVVADTETDNVNQFFHLLGTVDLPRGCCAVDPGGYQSTVYTSCCNVSKGIYYYTTYGNHQISAVHLHHAPLDAAQFVRFTPICMEQMYMHN